MTRQWAYWALFLLFAVVLSVSRLKHLVLPGAAPNGLCIQDLQEANVEHWITIPGHHYLGSPVFSPDGEWIAFDAYKSGSGVVSEVWIVRRDGTKARRLAVGATPRWHPDGKKLIFMREQRNDDEALPLGIFTVDSDGRNETFICRGRWPDWSPDGERIVFSDGAGDTRQGGIIEGHSIFVARADGSERSVVTQGDCPSWSPDGTRIAFCKPGAGGTTPEIHVVNLETRAQQPAAYGWFRANWNREATELVCNGFAGQSQSEMISIVLGEAPSPRGLQTRVENAMSPCYSGNGQTIVFAAPH